MLPAGQKSDPLSLLSTTEATSGELCPVLGFSVLKRHGVGPAECNRSD